jgi:hypothetical protein
MRLERELIGKLGKENFSFGMRKMSEESLTAGLDRKQGAREKVVELAKLAGLASCTRPCSPL